MNYCLKCANPLHHKIEEGFDRWMCDACGWVFYNNQRPCVTAIPVKDGQVMLHRRGIEPAKGTWDIPGGFIEVGEKPEDALHREVAEELGLKIIRYQLLGFYPDDYGLDDIHTLNIAYVCEFEDAPVQGSNEIDEVKWFTWNALPGAYAFPSVPTMLADASKMKIDW